MTIQYGGLLVVAVAAFVAPLIARLVPRRLVPPVVLEVLVGIVVGPQVLDLVRAEGAAEVLYLLGLGFLLFLAGQDVRPERFRGPTFAHASALALVPLLVLAIAVVRGGPALLYRRRLGTAPAAAAGLLQATTLTFPVVVAGLGSALGLLSPASAAALIGASLLSVLLFPAAALALRPWSRAPVPDRDEFVANP